MDEPKATMKLVAIKIQILIMRFKIFLIPFTTHMEHFIKGEWRDEERLLLGFERYEIVVDDVKYVLRSGVRQSYFKRTPWDKFELKIWIVRIVNGEGEKYFPSFGYDANPVEAIRLVTKYADVLSIRGKDNVG